MGLYTGELISRWAFNLSKTEALLMPVLACYKLNPWKMRKKLTAIEIWITVILMGAGCVAKEKNEIESVTESGTKFEITWTFFFFLDNPKITKTSQNF